MTETMGTSSGASAPGSPSQDASTRDVAKEEARGVAQDASQSGKQVAGAAKEQAGEVAGEAKYQARALVEQTRQQISSQGVQQQQRAATGLRSLADELTGMVNGQAGSGLATDMARQASDRVRTAADWLESREPSDILNDVRRFARQRPGAFLAAAAAMGFVGGRMTRGIADEAREDSSSGQQGGYSTGYSTSYNTGYDSGYADSDYTTGTTGTGSLSSAPGVTTPEYTSGGRYADGGLSTPAQTSQGPAGDETATFGVTTPGSGVGDSRSGALIEDPAGEDRIGGRRSGEDPI